MSWRWSVEYAKTGRGKCGVCREKIEQGTLRIGDAGGAYVKWSHLQCQKVLPSLQSVESLRGLDLITGEGDLEKIASWFSQGGANKKKRKAKDVAAEAKAMGDPKKMKADDLETLLKTHGADSTGDEEVKSGNVDHSKHHASL